MRHNVLRHVAAGLLTGFGALVATGTLFFMASGMWSAYLVFSQSIFVLCYVPASYALGVWMFMKGIANL